HRQARHTVLVAHAPLRGQQGRKLLHEERLPLVAVPAGVGLPVGVEARLAADREDDDRVLGIEELRDPGLERPAARLLGGAEAVGQHQGRVGALGRGVPRRGQRELDLDGLLHGGGLHPQRDAVGRLPLHPVEPDAGRRCGRHLQGRRFRLDGRGGRGGGGGGGGRGGGALLGLRGWRRGGGGGGGGGA